MAVVMEEVFGRRHAALARCLADIIYSHSGAKVFIEQEEPALTRVVNGQTEHARMDLVFNLNGSVTYFWMSLSLLLSLAIRPWFLLPAQNQDLWPRERRRPNLTGTHTSMWSRSFLRQLADLVHMLGNSLTVYCEMLTIHQLLSETLGPPIKVSSLVPSPNNNLRQPLRDSWGLLSQRMVLMGVLVPPYRERTQRFQSQACCRCAMWPCCDFTSSDDDEHNTDNNFLLLFADVDITPTLLEGLTEVDVLHIALGCRLALDIFTISQRHFPTPDHEPLPHDPEFATF